VRKLSVCRGTQAADLTYCHQCDFLYLSNPQWLNIAYKSPFYGDTGYVRRNIETARFVKLLLLCHEALNGNKTQLSGCDYGTGLGIFPRLMRDYGYDFWGADEYADMHLIKPFVNPVFNPVVRTAFEVVEHVISLPHFLEQKILGSDIFIFSTSLRADNDIPPLDWWYYCFEFGQHISFHSRKSICYSLDSAGGPSYRLVSVANGLYAVIFDKNWEGSLWAASTIYKSPMLKPIEKLLNRVYRRPSLINEDHRHALRGPVLF
jgi:hypothetical protein